MDERPILFRAPMVRAILEGLKTQTRRAVKPPPGHNFAGFTTSSTCAADVGKAVWGAGDVMALLHDAHRVRCPYGKPGDRLWVKETWRPRLLNNGYPGAPDLSDVSVQYAADGELRIYADEEIDQANPDWSMPKAADRGNVSPLFMPRWASRITLEITDVRVQRLQEISEADAAAEGTPSREVRAMWLYGADADERARVRLAAAVDPFRSLWDSINGAGAWDANPWVWALTFQRVAP